MVNGPGSEPARGWEPVIPNPKLKLMDQVREVLRVKHYAIRAVHTENRRPPKCLAANRMRRGLCDAAAR
jgi:hypothetical protein